MLAFTTEDAYVDDVNVNIRDAMNNLYIVHLAHFIYDEEECLI